uniref:Uncharacterized protein n=1 Tax=Arundo donax TaxID=35708 RepID=A0A0A9CQI5_ARUDO
MDRQMTGERREEERYRTRDTDRHDYKRSRYDDSHYHLRRDEQSYSRDDYRDRRHR